MPPNAEPIRRFYDAFAALDAATMGAAYAPDARFRDPVFELQGGDRIGAMWRMLCDASSAARQRHGDAAWRLEFGAIDADAGGAKVRWQAHYRFGPQARPVHNTIDARFVLRAGLIVEHVDCFGFWRWARQALGLPGWLLGGTPWLRARVRRRAGRQLDRFIAGAAPPPPH